jgi:bla regulator protein blaR1
MTDLVVLLLATGAGSASVIALVLVIRAGLRRAFGATLAYGAWVIVPVVMLAMLVAAADDVSRATPGDRHTFTYAADALATFVMPVSAWSTALVAIWASGVLLSATVLWLAQVRFVTSLGTLTPRNGLWYAQRADVSPGVMGLLRPIVVVPADFESRYTAEEQRLILAHERTHLRRGDLIANAVGAVVQCLLWFNPLAHLATSRFRFDQELACDATTLRDRSRSRKIYAAALLKTLSHEPALPFSSRWQSAHPLKGRILNLQKPNMSRRRRVCGHLLVVALSATLAAAAWDVRPVQEHRAVVDARARAAGVGAACPLARARLAALTRTLPAALATPKQ